VQRELSFPAGLQSRTTILTLIHAYIRLDIRYRNSREIVGKPKNITVSHKNGKWYASVQTELEIEQTIPQSTSAIGIDMELCASLP
jgi:transposase